MAVTAVALPVVVALMVVGIVALVFVVVLAVPAHKECAKGAGPLVPLLGTAVLVGLGGGVLGPAGGAVSETDQEVARTVVVGGPRKQSISWR